MATGIIDKATPIGSLCRVAFGVSYDGSDFHGFAIQPNASTVAGALLGALSKITGETHTYTCAGRTDTGVHAHAQVVHVDLDQAILRRRYGNHELVVGTEIPDLARGLSHQLGPSIVVWRAVIVDPRFDARRSATARRYRYDLQVSGRFDPLLAGSTWWVQQALDLSAMRLGCDPLLGSHDFAGFCRRPAGHVGPITRRVVEAHWSVLDPRIWRFEIESSSFCHQMVRSIVGAMVAIGVGKMRPSDLLSRLQSGDRSGAPPLAPPAGLCLIAVSYPDDLGGVWK
jgi:tRNA pseudouridine38-40 synthase